MHTIVTLALKDLRLLVRDRMGMFWIFVFPLLFALFFGAVFSDAGPRGANPLPVAVINEDLVEGEASAGSHKFIKRLEQSDALKVQTLSLAEAQDQVRKGKLVAYVIVPRGFGQVSFFGPNAPALRVGIDPARRAESGYLQGILTETAYAGMQELFTNPEQFQKQIEKNIQSLDHAKDLKPEQRQNLRQFLGSPVGWWATAVSAVPCDSGAAGG